MPCSDSRLRLERVGWMADVVGTELAAYEPIARQLSGGRPEAARVTGSP
jgi:hypothetical protein